MKTFLFAVAFVLLVSCQQQDSKYRILLQKIDHLETKLKNTYKPGFGDLMSSIQNHHAKLWFAGQSNNWKLANFEVHEINEALEAIEKFQPNRKETKQIQIIYPAISTLKMSIEKGDLKLFNASYTEVTAMCNTCHQQTNFEFNIVKIPEVQQFSNQSFLLK